ncbi:hypothetical protein PPL_04576 [Heterostelium album PN500]|uniref:Uncharacterized protein n=1 Tax=Heterostelium pallidum (strain ATCC 26659 / Pp 5 / PN500) TaxID=670386 RepID=D3B7Y8_HETP5|nr:hypothetical protein PPL_04576 [Heterostelium album PN500]EFA82156.1 hypothetical protein PPL_04576 [Heterostelium album PN500]|eukprot:XP_020434273.1 hypothetical protein PPL_04576 [Heterostelium album PN500]
MTSVQQVTDTTMLSEVDIHRITSILQDISLLRLECDWVNDQTDLSFNSILEKAESNFLYIELLWSIGKELSPYFDLQWPSEKKYEDLKSPLFELLKKMSFTGNLQYIFNCDSNLSQGEQQDVLIRSRLSLLEFMFFQLQMIQLDLFNKEQSMEVEEQDTTMQQQSSDELRDDLINKIQVLSDIFQVQFNNWENFVVILNTIHTKIETVLADLPSDFMSEPFFKNTVFTDEEKKTIEELSLILFNDYSKRSEVLCKRLDVTLESLLWSEKVETKLDELNRIIRYQREVFPTIHHYSFQDLICTHRDILKIIKTSLDSKSSAQLVKNIIVGNVPDRGGRPGDKKIAMPSFHKRVEYSNQNYHNRSKKHRK